jgi:hypothetical protein
MEIARLTKSDEASIKNLSEALRRKKQVERRLAQLGRATKTTLAQIIEGDCNRG